MNARRSSRHGDRQTASPTAGQVPVPVTAASSAHRWRPGRRWSGYGSRRQAFIYAFAFHSEHGPRQASLVYPSGRSEVNQGLAVRGSGITQATVRGVRVNLSEPVARAAVGPIVDPPTCLCCAPVRRTLNLSLFPACA